MMLSLLRWLRRRTERLGGWFYHLEYRLEARQRPLLAGRPLTVQVWADAVAKGIREAQRGVERTQRPTWNWEKVYREEE